MELCSLIRIHQSTFLRVDDGRYFDSFECFSTGYHLAKVTTLEQNNQQSMVDTGIVRKYRFMERGDLEVVELHISGYPSNFILNYIPCLECNREFFIYPPPMSLRNTKNYSSKTQQGICIFGPCENLIRLSNIFYKRAHMGVGSFSEENLYEDTNEARSLQKSVVSLKVI
ncbi:hypothetical protein FF38_06487 [Lucilia cuprina]|uniref:Uncharacterized protein n=1 Tax=Lucilia cuprina TaxID=7375 RepID=A0A0L0BM43_LUCCU|nr:hypothetical protein FF38_06487 [Lucilia cuprina]